jgi:sensor domain CHASE-containing protein
MHLRASSHSASANPALRLRPLVIATGIACVAIGVVVQIGWHIHSVTLVCLRPGLAPMQYNTAVCFVLGGLALAAWGMDRVPLAPRVLGSLVATLALLTVGEYFFHADWRIDSAFFPNYVPIDGLRIGSMSITSASCFSFAGLGLACLGAPVPRRWRPGILGAMASILIGVTVVAFLGYWFNPPGVYGWGKLNILALHTGSGFALLGAGMFLIAWQIAVRPGEHTPPWLPASLAAAVLTTSFLLYCGLRAKESEDISETVKAAAEGVRIQVGARIEARSRTLVRMAERWEPASGGPEIAWKEDAANYVRDSPDLQALERVDASRHITGVFPLAGNEAKLNLDLTLDTEGKAALDRAEREGQPVITPIMPLAHGGLGCSIYVPIILDGKPGGFIAAVIDAKPYLDKCLPPSIAAGEAIQFSEDGAVFYERDAGTPPGDAGWVVEDSVELHGATWDIRMWPTPALAARLDSPLPVVVLIGGVLGSLLLAAACYYAQRSARKSAEVASANAALKAAFDQVETLEGLLPICCYCNRIRDDSGYWSQIGTYLKQHTKASPSHGYCPECAVKAYEDLGLEIPEHIQAELNAGNFD